MSFAREVARRKGITVEEFLAQDRRRAESPDFPGENCIASDVAQGLADLAQGKKDIKISLDWLEIARVHVEQCVYCQTLVSVMTPPSQHS